MTTITTRRATWERLDLHTWVSPEGWAVLYRDGLDAVAGWYLAGADGADLRWVGAGLDREDAALRQADRLLARIAATEAGGTL